MVYCGQTVWSRLHWAAVPADDEAANNCAPDPTLLRVIPPDETTQLSVPHDFGILHPRQLDVIHLFKQD